MWLMESGFRCEAYWITFLAGVAYGITFSTVDEASRSAQLIFSAPSRDQVPIVLKLTCCLRGTLLNFSQEMSPGEAV